MLTRLAESSGRPLERHGNVSPREMTVHGAHAPGQNPAYRPAHSPSARSTCVRLARPSGVRDQSVMPHRIQPSTWAAPGWGYR